MAWPCISRVCCLARFWNQFDKSDLSVPLTIQNYSDIAEQEVRSVTKQVSASERAPGNEYSSPPRATGSLPAHADAPGPRGSFRSQREPSYKPREDYHPSSVPFTSLTQYTQDYKPWPIPRKDNFPWISNGTSTADSPHKGDREETARGQQQQQQGPDHSQTSSYRQEYRPWTGVKPAKSSKKNLPTQFGMSGTEAVHVPPETSYQAAYNGDIHRSAGSHQGQNIIPSSSSNVQTVPVHPPVSHSPSSLQHSVLPETTKAEEHLVRTKLPPNPSAVFQSGSRASNI